MQNNNFACRSDPYLAERMHFPGTTPRQFVHVELCQENICARFISVYWIFKEAHTAQCIDTVKK